MNARLRSYSNARSLQRWRRRRSRENFRVCFVLSVASDHATQDDKTSNMEVTLLTLTTRSYYEASLPSIRSRQLGLMPPLQKSITSLKTNYGIGPAFDVNAVDEADVFRFARHDQRV